MSGRLCRAKFAWCLDHNFLRSRTLNFHKHQYRSTAEVFACLENLYCFASSIRTGARGCWRVVQGIYIGLSWPRKPGDSELKTNRDRNKQNIPSRTITEVILPVQPKSIPVRKTASKILEARSLEYQFRAT
jgi:hypothetical protein